MLFTIMKILHKFYVSIALMKILYYNLDTFTIIFIGTGEFNIAPSFNSYTILIQFLARLLALHIYMCVCLHLGDWTSTSLRQLIMIHWYHDHWRANAEITHVFSKGVQVFVCGLFD